VPACADGSFGELAHFQKMLSNEFSAAGGTARIVEARSTTVFGMAVTW
jgi:hypothetical protein